MIEKSYDTGFRPVGYTQVYEAYREAQHQFDWASGRQARERAKRKLRSAIVKLTAAMQTEVSTWEKLN